MTQLAHDHVSFTGSTLNTLFRVVTFRATRGELLGLNARNLALGLLLTWLVGMGRVWDHADVPLLRRLGAGSMVYVFMLSAMLWVFIRPMRLQGLTYLKLATFVSLAALPGLLYAIPVERWMEPDAAVATNRAFLAIVALWRVSLLFYFLVVAGALRPITAGAVLLLPLAMLVSVIALAGLDHAAFLAMGGEMPRPDPPTRPTALFWINALAMAGLAPLALVYAQSLLRRRKA